MGRPDPLRHGPLGPAPGLLGPAERHPEERSWISDALSGHHLPKPAVTALTAEDTMATTRRVAPFAEFGRQDIGLVGGKNASPGEMTAHLTAAGVRVPGVATTADAYGELLDGHGLRTRICPAAAVLPPLPRLVVHRPSDRPPGTDGLRPAGGDSLRRRPDHGPLRPRRRRSHLHPRPRERISRGHRGRRSVGPGRDRRQWPGRPRRAHGLQAEFRGPGPGPRDRCADRSETAEGGPRTARTDPF